ncbi:MAG: hypothetical protein M3Y85_07110 [Bacteroidota bacterium]|nr:hypothetical protein [Bacteroidota bacterium]
MFIAQVDETDIYDSSGQQVNDINSVVEWLQASFSTDKVAKHKQDSDDDNARYYHALKQDHFSPQPFTILKKNSSPGSSEFPKAVDDTKLSAGYLAIQSPPPKVHTSSLLSV